jgi:hypothetical protein
MKTFFTILLTLFSFTLSASEKEDFKDYILRGKLEETHMYGDFYAKNYFNIYNNMIFYYGESDTAFVDKFPDGEFELVTRNNSKIKVNVADGMLNNLIVYDEESFRKNEKKVDENNYYCENGIFRGLRYYLYEKNHYKDLAKNVKIKNLEGETHTLADHGFSLYKEENKYIVLENYWEETILGPIYGREDYGFSTQNRWLLNINKSPKRDSNGAAVLSVENCLLLSHDKNVVELE